MRQHTCTVLMLFLLYFSPVYAAKELRIGISADFDSAHPLAQQSIVGDYVREFVQRALSFIPAGEQAWAPGLLTKLPALNTDDVRLIGPSGQQKMEVHFEIKNEAVWSDGAPITGEDIRFTWEVAMSSEVAVIARQIFLGIESIQVDHTNAKKFTVIYKEPTWNFFQLGGFRVLPKHVEEPLWRKYRGEAERYVRHSYYTREPTHKGLYSGPYVVSEIQQGDHITLKKNPKWWGHPAQIETIIIKLLPKTATLVSNLRSGTIDMISSTGLSLEQALEFEKAINAEHLPFTVHFSSGLGYDVVLLQMKNPILADLNVRRALRLAIDRREISKAFYGGRGEPAYHFIGPADPWFVSVPAESPSQRQAKKLLEAAGWKVGPGGIREKNGQKLSLILNFVAEHRLRELEGTFLQGEWRKIGVEIIIKQAPPRVFFGQWLDKADFSALALFGQGMGPESVPREGFSSKSIPSPANQFTGFNFGSWRNAHVDELIDRLSVTMDAKVRLTLVKELVDEYVKDIPAIPLVYRTENAVTPKTLSNYQMGHLPNSDANRVEYWRL